MLCFRQDVSGSAHRPTRSQLWRRRIDKTDAGDIDLLDIGKPDGHAVILITHGLGSLESFEEIAEGMEARFPGRRIVAYSRPGRGMSPLNPNVEASSLLTFEALQALPAILSALGIVTVDLVAHSDGAAVAMLFACANPLKVGRIVGISPQVHADRLSIDQLRELVTNNDHLDDVKRLGADHGDVGVASRCWVAMHDALAANPDHVLGGLARIDAPMLLVQGLRDEGTQHQMSALSTRVRGPMKWVILRNDGHFPQHDSTDIVLDLICGHLQDVDAKGTSGRRQTRAVS
ncbi:alpha/beta fold hydrolase [Rhizobium sp. G21]|uniref:alpha/beta fold hydrolase n=1 Tax=Rhizobium sp. G21 TaxID=2758439 RepID=UPI0016015FBF|nr:alpha/beta fold hydrolase [Rhizobium sp. G21]MBB1249917.1 alpha/beta fold hydrolase [Rhizobium sp. G21]